MASAPNLHSNNHNKTHNNNSNNYALPSVKAKAKEPTLPRSR